MAAGFFNHLADAAKARAVSAGTKPGDRVHPVVIDAMKEAGVDIGSNRPQRLTEDLARGASLLVTMGCGDECPVIAGLERDDWPLRDPKGLPLDEVRQIREDIRQRVRALILTRGWSTTRGEPSKSGGTKL